MSDLATLIQASAHQLPMIPDKSIQCVVTSPPYFGLRKYDGAQDVEWGEVSYSPMAGLPPLTVPVMTCPLGNEPTIEAYIGHLILCAREWRRVLKDDGVVFVNLGDSYVGYKGDNYNKGQKRGTGEYSPVPSSHNQGTPHTTSLRSKNLMLIPARFALAMQADGWILRSEVIWHKPNPMPESVTDRPTKAHEQIYLFSKRERYFYDAVAVQEPSVKAGQSHPLGGQKWSDYTPDKNDPNYRGGHEQWKRTITVKDTRNLRTVWNVANKPFSGAHFACFPPALVEPMIKAGTSEKGCCVTCGSVWKRVTEKVDMGRAESDSQYAEGMTAKRLAQKRQAYRAMGLEGPPPPITVGWKPTCDCPPHDPIPCTVLDPFSGSGTALRVAVKLGRKAIGVDLSRTYLEELASERLTVQMEMVS